MYFGTNERKSVNFPHLFKNDWSLGEQWILFPENLDVSQDKLEGNIAIQSFSCLVPSRPRDSYIRYNDLNQKHMLLSELVKTSTGNPIAHAPHSLPASARVFLLTPILPIALMRQEIFWKYYTKIWLAKQFTVSFYSLDALFIVAVLLAGVNLLEIPAVVTPR